jgi:hypothetical protein
VDSPKPTFCSSNHDSVFLWWTIEAEYGDVSEKSLTTVWFEIRLNEKQRCKTIVS